MFALVAALLVTAVPTNEELETLGKSMSADFMAGKDPVTSRVDASGLLDRSLNGTTVPAEFRNGFTKGLMQGFKQSWGALAKELGAGGSVRFTHVLERDGVKGIQLRVLYKGGAFNFVEILVTKDASNALRLVDFFDLAAGTYRSEDVRMLAFPLLADLKLDTLDRMLGKEESVLIKHIDALKKMNEASIAADWGKVESLWQGLPKTVQDHRLFIKPYISALSEAGDDAKYQKAMARYLALYPEDGAAQVMGIDFYFLRKKWPECLKSINAVEKRAGTDAWFDVLRANVKVGDGKPAEARADFESAMKREPTLPDPYYTLIDLALGEKKYAEVAKWMTQCEKLTGVSFDAHAEGFEGFLASKEGKAYDKLHPAK